MLNSRLKRMVMVMAVAAAVGGWAVKVAAGGHLIFTHFTAATATPGLRG